MVAPSAFGDSSVTTVNRDRHNLADRTSTRHSTMIPESPYEHLNSASDFSSTRSDSVTSVPCSSTGVRQEERAIHVCASDRLDTVPVSLSRPEPQTATSTGT